MRHILRRIYWWLEKRIFPGLRYSQYHYHETLQSVVPMNCHWLDLGCGHQMFASWMTKEEQDIGCRASLLVGIDTDLEGLKKNGVISDRIFGDIEHLPLARQSFDLVTANMVVEHLPAPETILGEVHRILKPGGLFVFHTPNRRALQAWLASLFPQKIKTFLIRVLEERREEDVFKTFYRMNTSAEIVEYARKQGFELVELKRVSTNAIFQLIAPVAVLELIYLRVLESKRLEHLRSNLIAVLRKIEHSRPLTTPCLPSSHLASISANTETAAGPTRRQANRVSPAESGFAE
jgi:SAM-dependent methyltransferase